MLCVAKRDETIKDDYNIMDVIIYILSMDKHSKDMHISDLVSNVHIYRDIVDTVMNKAIEEGIIDFTVDDLYIHRYLLRDIEL